MDCSSLQCTDLICALLAVVQTVQTGLGGHKQGKYFRVSGVPDHPQLATTMLLPSLRLVAYRAYTIKVHEQCVASSKWPRSNRREAKIVSLQGYLCHSATVSDIKT